MAVQGKTKLVAIVDDDDSVRTALHGMLRKVRDLGMPLLSVMRVEPEPADISEANAAREGRRQ